MIRTSSRPVINPLIKLGNLSVAEKGIKVIKVIKTAHRRRPPLHLFLINLIWLLVLRFLFFSDSFLTSSFCLITDYAPTGIWDTSLILWEWGWNTRQIKERLFKAEVFVIVGGGCGGGRVLQLDDGGRRAWWKATWRRMPPGNLI